MTASPSIRSPADLSACAWATQQHANRRNSFSVQAAAVTASHMVDDLLSATPSLRPAPAALHPAHVSQQASVLHVASFTRSHSYTKPDEQQLIVPGLMQRLQLQCTCLLPLARPS